MGPYVHHLDPILTSILGVHLWWYGLSYTLGFWNAHRYITGHRRLLGMSPTQVYDLSLLLCAGVLVGGRMVEVVFYEWPFYHDHPALIPAVWIGGMATHGLLAGGLAGVVVFARLHGRRFLEITDALAIPAAAIMGLGRIGNFIDGQIVGSVTTVPWAVKFPDAEGFRHPVVLYDGLKNLLLIPVLMRFGGAAGRPGRRTGLFLFLYAFLRIFVDVFREYPTSLLGLATGQVLNLLMSALGLGLLVVCSRKAATPETSRPSVVPTTSEPEGTGLGWRRGLFAAILTFCLTMPSDWTQDIPVRYGTRHPGLVHSWLYPAIPPASR